MNRLIFPSDLYIKILKIPTRFPVDFCLILIPILSVFISHWPTNISAAHKSTASSSLNVSDISLSILIPPIKRYDFK